MRALITGGAGFIGSALCRRLASEGGHEVLVLDKLTYAGDRRTLEGADADGRCTLVEVDICDGASVDAAFTRFAPDVVFHLAAESHVDRSIAQADAFVRTNLLGTFEILRAARAYWAELGGPAREAFRMVHVSTDEVFGALGPDGAFAETTPYAPRSPYAATKAGADHLARAWRATYGLPVMITNCANNYGPYQFPEKLIPLMILKALEGAALPVYGDGSNVRDWIHVDDHVEALIAVAERGRPGETYLAGARAERANLAVVEAICDLIDARVGPLGDGPRRSLIGFVDDRPGHDHRYAIDPTKLETELGWRPRTTFEDGLAATVDWYLDRRDWWEPIRDGRYRGERLGLIS